MVAMFPPDFSVADSTMKGQEHWITALPGWILLTRAASCGVSKRARCRRTRYRALLWITVTCSNSTLWMQKFSEAIQNSITLRPFDMMFVDSTSDVEVRSTSQNISNLDWIRYDRRLSECFFANKQLSTWHPLEHRLGTCGRKHLDALDQVIYTIWIDHSLWSSWTNCYRKISKTFENMF